jgi:hypothetical protein
MTVRRTARPCQQTANRYFARDIQFVRTFEELLFKLRLCDLDLHSLINLLGMAAFVVGVVLNRGREKGIDKRSLP